MQCFVLFVVVGFGCIGCSNGGSILKYGSSYGFVCYEYGFLMFASFRRGEDFEYVDCFACFGCGQVYVSVVSEFGVKCES